VGPVVVETERLRLRAWERADAPGLVELFADADVACFINDGEPVTEEQALRFIDRYERIQRERGWCRWALELKREPRALAGFCGVGCTFAPEIELGWTLRRDLWGEGLATEAARAALDYCFGTVGFARIVSAVDPDNARSIGVARRAGMTAEGTLEIGETQLLRFVAENPRAEVPSDPRFVPDCEGETRGSSLRDQPEL
jgi:RimJ/RimL family protein N-acetyltransferase